MRLLIFLKAFAANQSGRYGILFWNKSQGFAASNAVNSLCFNAHLCFDVMQYPLALSSFKEVVIRFFQFSKFLFPLFVNIVRDKVGVDRHFLSVRRVIPRTRKLVTQFTD